MTPATPKPATPKRTAPKASAASEDRTAQVVTILTESFADLMAHDVKGLRHKFRAMAADPFAFYRGSACLFYADVVPREDRWADERTGRIWIQGDLHAQNFGTYMDGRGVLIFDVNDYDEAYLGHFTWDLQRLAASVAVLGWTKALSDDDIAHLIETYVRGYLAQVHDFVDSDADHEWALTLQTATGAVHEALVAAQLRTRLAFLDSSTVVEGHVRRFDRSGTQRELGGAERKAVLAAYDRYLATIPESERLDDLAYAVKDVVGKTGFGIGSAGLPAYNLLVEGHSQALENDVVLTMKQGGVPALARTAEDDEARDYFEHQGHRTAVSQHTLQAHADPWIGWTRMKGGPHDGVGFVVLEQSPYQADLDWAELTEVDDLAEVLEQLGRATAKVHCVSDVDAPSEPLVDFQTEEAIAEVVSGREDELVADVVAFGLEYGERARGDHALFVDAFRSGRFTGLDSSPA